MFASRSPAARRKSVSLGERDMNRYDDDNLTLPITKREQQGRKRSARLSEVQIFRRQAVSGILLLTDTSNLASRSSR